MKGVRKQLFKLLSSMSAGAIRDLHSKLVGPRLQSLQRDKATLEKRLRKIERQIADLSGPVVVRRRRGRPRKARPAAKPARRAKRGTVVSRLRRVLEGASAPMRVTEICNRLSRAGLKKTKSLVNYVNRTLSINPSFARVGRGLYAMAGKGSASGSKKP